jgi:hypothetical protein
MMTVRQPDGSVSWQMLAILSSVAVVFAGGAIWLGSVAKQTDINAADIAKIYNFINTIVQHDADTIATHRSFEQRIDRLEKGK